MKFFAVVALVMVSVAVASPASANLERSVKVSRTADGATTLTPCIECPCTGWAVTDCKCIPNGCCCT
ncbi:hypothetical protein PMIN01_06373 [Paraphaeosphaeria minitans]|uniref:Uncharacterized protein n=1 Tax=Paraphaeosphaeria minitans TaxID=565426 RepID=A0A9P6GH33_9PLEO|nr:hypothetical protein PMIN01_06373 [Paraphaeosphaeria minitans]